MGRSAGTRTSGIRSALANEHTAVPSARRLVLLRHAKAEPPTTADDSLRPLALRGREQAGKVGAALAAAGLVPDLVLVSSALRTRQTWDLASGSFGGTRGGGPGVAVTVSDELYQANVRDVLALLADVHDDVRTVLVVGHEPTMAAAASFLAGPGSDDASLAQVRVGVPTATYSVLEAPLELRWASWSRSSATLTQVARPS
ncbi:SixA phosphatase family protein [Antribacter soli]|uniref:SixA phosphatase family protein n=1 Tax=Antribacter soli TaxID=2910976 RepID=UPI0027DFD140|nr:histidine phosphatase family protein [Antribacter soli]